MIENKMDLIWGGLIECGRKEKHGSALEPFECSHGGRMLAYMTANSSLVSAHTPTRDRQRPDSTRASLPGQFS